jgi:hypothetical protein
MSEQYAYRPQNRETETPEVFLFIVNDLRFFEKLRPFELRISRGLRHASCNRYNPGGFAGAS